MDVLDQFMGSDHAPIYMVLNMEVWKYKNWNF